MMFRLRRYLAASAVALLIVGIDSGAHPAFAAAPPNDTQAGAVEVPSTLPWHYTEDTTEATVDSGEAVAQSMCLSAGAPDFQHAVWFHATVPDGLTQAIAVDTSASSYGTGIAILQDNGGTLSGITCVPSTYVSPAPPFPGSYYLVVFGDGTTPGVTSGTLDMTVDVAPPPPNVSMTIDGTGTATKQGGAWVSGTVTCDGGGDNGTVVEIDGNVTQRVGRLLISSVFFSGQSIPCDGATYPWSGFAPPSNGLFSGGKAITATASLACSDFGCNSAFASATVKLNRAAIK
jgi:hypothetical protein